MLRVTVVYALPGRAWERALTVPEGCTVLGAVERSGLLAEQPELAARPLDLGVWQHACDSARPARDGDRIEVYRPLRIDPKEARRLRARKGRHAR